MAVQQFAKMYTFLDGRLICEAEDVAFEIKPPKKGSGKRSGRISAIIGSAVPRSGPEFEYITMLTGNRSVELTIVIGTGSRIVATGKLSLARFKADPFGRSSVSIRFKGTVVSATTDPIMVQLAPCML